MQGIEAITAEIIAAAKAEAEETVRKAEANKAARLAELDARLAAQRAEREQRLAQEAEDTVGRRLTLAGLEARMAKLGAKQAVVSEVYALALDKAAALDNKAYRALFARLVAAAAQSGDGVRVAAPDVKRLDKAWLDGVAASSGKKLKLLADNCDARGGAIVVGADSETDLTLETLLAEIRERSEGEVVRALFGDAE